MGIVDRIRTLFGSEGESEASVGEPLPAPVEAIPEDRRMRKRVNARPGTNALIVDDSRTVILALRRMLESSGMNVSEAYDGETAVEMAQARRPDLIFLDIVMPSMNGFAVLRKLRRDLLTNPIPVIMMSGNEQATEQFLACKIPADDFLAKPFSRRDVFTRIEELLDQEQVPHRRNGLLASLDQPAAPYGQPGTH